VSPPALRHAPFGPRAACVAAGARQLAVEVAERIDEIQRLEGAVSPADRRLRQDAAVDEAWDCLVDRLPAAPDERRRALDGDDRRPRATRR